MRRDVLSLAAICCSLLDCCAAERIRCARRATRRPPAPKIDRFGAAQRCSPLYVEIDRPIFDDHWAITQAEGAVLGFGWATTSS